ncbi:hypothetical protein SAMN06298216_4437 [Spirosomataceae bacterium TFI 002]|nr:hypothetical protein SAMN06298216_4437 [Spirosomataceae bacterium TFI 002]
MYRQVFRCTTHEPLILFKKAKTEQSTETLEYIPGSLFRGVVATKLFNAGAYEQEIDNLIFNGKVWFGDAHLLIKDQRSNPIPFSIHKYQKTPVGQLPYINLSLEIAPKLKHKQVREGYFIEENREYFYQSPDLSERMKAARSLEHRASEEGGMYLYRYIEPFQTFEFSVYTKEVDGLLNQVNNYFAGTIYIGKSKSSEFGGKVTIEAVGDAEPLSNATEEIEVKMLFAASNWCFLNKYGSYTSQVTSEMVCGNVAAKIDWSKTFLRFRTYAPFNAHRNAYDAQRLIVEKGSVITFKEPVIVAKQFLENRIGVHKTEGFGEVEYNLAILDQGSFDIKKNETTDLRKKQSENSSETAKSNDPLLEALNRRKAAKEKLIIDYSIVEKIIKDNKFNKNIGHSQWGNVLRKCNSAYSISEMRRVLFEDDGKKLNKNKTSKWDEIEIKKLKSVLEACKSPQAFKMFLKQKINEGKND